MGAGAGKGAGPSGPSREALLGAILGSQAIGILGDVYSQTVLTRARGRFQQQQLDFSRRMAELQARDVEVRGRRAIEEYQRAVSRTVGSQRAAMAAQGVDVSTGSALDIQEETRALGAEDLAQIRANIFREAWGLRAEAAGLATSASIVRSDTRAAGRESVVAGGIQLARAGTQWAVGRYA